MKSNKTQMLVVTSLFAALIFIGTRLCIPLGVNNRIVHVGDALVYLSACILPTPYAMASSAIGAGLADFTTPGCMIWVIPTMVIKPILVLFFTPKNIKILNRRNVVAVFLAGITGIVLYVTIEGMIYGSFWVALLGVPADLIQPIGSGVLFSALAYTFDTMKLKYNLNFNKHLK